MCDNGHIISPKIWTSLTRHTSELPKKVSENIKLVLKIIKKDRFWWPSMLLHCKGRKKRQIIYCVSASASTQCPFKKIRWNSFRVSKMVTQQYSSRRTETKKCDSALKKKKKIIVLVWMFIVNKASVEFLNFFVVIFDKKLNFGSVCKVVSISILFFMLLGRIFRYVTLIPIECQVE